MKRLITLASLIALPLLQSLLLLVVTNGLITAEPFMVMLSTVNKPLTTWALK